MTHTLIQSASYLSGDIPHPLCYANCIPLLSKGGAYDISAAVGKLAREFFGIAEGTDIDVTVKSNEIKLTDKTNNGTLYVLIKDGDTWIRAGEEFIGEDARTIDALSADIIHKVDSVWKKHQNGHGASEAPSLVPANAAAAVSSTVGIASPKASGTTPVTSGTSQGATTIINNNNYYCSHCTSPGNNIASSMKKVSSEDPPSHSHAMSAIPPPRPKEEEETQLEEALARNAYLEDVIAEMNEKAEELNIILNSK